MKDRIKKIQKKVGAKADGIIGPATLTALEEWLGLASKNGAVAQSLKVWPTQAEVRGGKSIFGAPGESNLVNITPPYPLLYNGKPVKTIRVHKLIADDVQAALTEVLEHYGLERIAELRLNVYGGSYAYRKTTGASSLSMHAWGIAFDFDPEHNAMNTHAPKAGLSCAACEEWWKIWERHGAVSMGRTYDKDWMHLQFAKF